MRLSPGEIYSYRHGIVHALYFYDAQGITWEEASEDFVKVFGVEPEHYMEFSTEEFREWQERSKPEIITQDAFALYTKKSRRHSAAA